MIAHADTPVAEQPSPDMRGRVVHARPVGGGADGVRGACRAVASEANLREIKSPQFAAILGA